MKKIKSFMLMSTVLTSLSAFSSEEIIIDNIGGKNAVVEEVIIDNVRGKNAVVVDNNRHGNVTVDNISGSTTVIIEDGLRNPFSFGPKINTLGIGLEGSYEFNDFLSARVGFNWMNFDFKKIGIHWATFDFGRDRILGGTKEVKASLGGISFPLMMDLHPFKGGFRISAGVIVNNMKFKGWVVDSGESLTLKFRNKVAPAVTIGYDGSFGLNENFGFTFEVGIMYANGIEANTNVTQLTPALQKVNDSIKKHVKILKVLPIVGVGLNIKL